MTVAEDTSSLNLTRLQALGASEMFRNAATAERDELLALAERSAGIGIWDIDLATGLARATPQFFRILGLEPTDEPVSIETLRARRHPDDRQRVVEGFRHAVASGTDSYEIEYRIVRPDGDIRWIFGRGRVYRNGGGVPQRYSGVDIDITDRKAAEAALSKSEARLSLAQEAAGIGIWDWDITAGSLDWSAQQFHLHGLAPAPQPLSYETWKATIHPEDRERAHSQVQRALSDHRIYEDEYRVTLADGGIRWIVAKARVISDRAGAAARMIGVCYDDSDRRRAIEALARLNAQLEQRIEERTAELVQLQKLDALGQLTGGIAHDFNNLLSVILGNLGLLRKRLGGDMKAQGLIDVAVKGAERGASLTKRLLAFARRQELESVAVDLETLVRGMSEILERSMGPLISIDYAFGDALSAARVDPNQLELAILNLAVNARDAMPGGGILRLCIRQRTAADGQAPGLAPGAYLVVGLSDSGTGMDAATLARAAEPFFTTKGLGKGTGLGLPMVHGLAAQSGGALVLASTPGQGTQAEIWLPASNDGPAAPAVEAPLSAAIEPLPRQRPLTVLVVDDDVLVAMGTAAMLEDLGHRVVEASSAKAALTVLRSEPEIDLVLTDHAMPGMTGVELAEIIAAERPDLPVLLATGYAQLPQGNRFSLPRLDKPFASETLARAIRDLKLP